jgi:hypothetical protein
VSLIEINPDLRRASSALERIATALESLLLHAYGVVTPSKAAVSTGPSGVHDIQYSSDDDTLRKELEELVMPSTVRERDGSIVAEEVGEDVLGTRNRTL